MITGIEGSLLMHIVDSCGWLEWFFGRSYECPIYTSDVDLKGLPLVHYLSAENEL